MSDSMPWYTAILMPAVAVLWLLVAPFVMIGAVLSNLSRPVAQ